MSLQISRRSSCAPLIWLLADFSLDHWVYDRGRCLLALGIWAPRDLRRLMHNSCVLHRAGDLRVSVPLERFILRTVLNAVRNPHRPRLTALAAQRKRKETGDERYYAPIERRDVSISQRLRDILEKPFKILFLEPMLIAITLYQSVCRASAYYLVR